MRRLRRVSSGSRCWMDIISSSRSRSLSENGDVLGIGQAVEQNGGFNLLHGLIALGVAQLRKVELTHGIGRHALLRECAQAAFEACIDLLLHERFGQREAVLRQHVVEHLLLRATGEGLSLAAADALAELGFKLRPALVGAELLGELVVALGEILMLDGLDRDVVADGFAGEAGVAEVSGVDDFQCEFLADLGAAKSLR